MLITTNEYSNHFLTKNRLLLDSCILNDLAVDQRVLDIITRANKIYSLFICTASLLEVGFGSTNKVDGRQSELARSFYDPIDFIPVDSTELHLRELNKIKDVPKFAYNPSANEWYAARFNLIKAMEINRIESKRAKDLRNDAIIFYSAWNSSCALVTNNVTDFLVFNDVQQHRRKEHLLPIFTINDLELSLTKNVSFPENLANPSRVGS